MIPTTAENADASLNFIARPASSSCPILTTSARRKYPASLGFPALATSSAGMAFAAGRPGGGVSRADALSHISELGAAVDCPLNANFESGFAGRRGCRQRSLRRLAGTPSTREMEAAFGKRG